MSIRTILAPVRGDGKGEGVLDHALAIAKRFDAHIQVVHARAKPDELIPFGTLLTESMRKDIIASAQSSAAEAEQHLRKLFDDYCANNGLSVSDTPVAPGSGVSASWCEETGKQADIVGLRGRLADLIVVPRPDGESQLGFNTLEAALMETGRLVLMTPPAAAETVGDHVAIAWNGSAEAARAVAMAMPALGQAKFVTILVSTERTDAADRLLNHLQWHQIDAKVGIFGHKSDEIGRSLLEAANHASADLLLMGGYGHSRRREMVMGGATQYIIENAELPVMMAH